MAKIFNPKSFLTTPFVYLSAILTVFLLPKACSAADKLYKSGLLGGWLEKTRVNMGYDNVDTAGAPAIVINGIGYLLGLISVIFLILIIYAGFSWMTAEGNEEKVTKARQLIINAAIGLIITACAYAISYGIFKMFFNQTLTTNVPQ
jgi:hypothetical protein